MAVQQTECYRVVTIGYLKTFIGDLIQDSSNGSVKYVNLNALSAEKRRDDYCPTYSELTGGTIIQTWKPGDTPNGDRDGITVNSSAILGGNYAANQLVDQRDLSLMYTRINSFSISASPTGVSACANSSTISYTHTYNRNSKYMNSSCVITSGGNTAVTDTNDTEVTLTANHSCTFDGWSNHTKKLNIPKNSSSTGEAPKRDIAVNGTIVFRGSTGTSTVTITQGALTGSTTYVVTTYTATTSVAAYPSTNQTFTDCGEHAWGAYGIRYYDKIERRCWIDNCGDIYPSISSDTVVGSGQVDVGTSAGTFSAVNCPDTSCSNSVNVTFTADGRTSNTLVFQRSGSNSCEQPEPPHTGDTPTDPQYSFAPDYADGSGPVVDRSKKNYGLRGTDNGAEIRRARGGCSQCLPAGTEFIFVAPVVVDWDSTNDSDMIRVDSIYVMDGGSKVNLKNYTSSNPLDLGQGVSIYYKDHDTDQGWYKKGHAGEWSYACSTIHINFTPNYSNSWKTITITLATDDEYANEWVDSHGGEYAGNDEIRNYKVASSWEYHIWQAPQGCNISKTDETGNYPRETHSGWSHCE